MYIDLAMIIGIVFWPMTIFLLYPVFRKLGSKLELKIPSVNYPLPKAEYAGMNSFYKYRYAKLRQEQRNRRKSAPIFLRRIKHAQLQRSRHAVKGFRVLMREPDSKFIDARLA